MSEEFMDAGRFAALASAFGGQLRRWPEHEQAQARAFARTEEGKAILDRASGLDAFLDSYAASAPTSALHARILNDATPAMARRRRTRLWWSGFGLAGVGFAGALAGAVMATVLAPLPRQEHAIFDADTTAFGDVAPARTATEEDL